MSAPGSHFPWTRALAAVLALTFAACNQTPTEITPLPRALGEVDAVHFEANGLRPLDPATEGVYVLWGLRQRNQAGLLGDFYVDEISGAILDAEGNPVSEFRTDDFAMRNIVGLLVTIEVQGGNWESPSGMQILSGTFIERVANLIVPISTAITAANGSLRVFTPTDGPNTNENSGFWMMDAAGDPLLDVPDTSAALEYEIFIEIGGQNLNVGRFESAAAADDFCRFCAENADFPPPNRPGDDLLENAPEGLTFPIDISGATVRISLEGRFNDFFQQSQLVVLEAVLPPGLTGGEIIPFTNLASSFPTGRSVLY